VDSGCTKIKWCVQGVWLWASLESEGICLSREELVLETMMYLFQGRILMPDNSKDTEESEKSPRWLFPG
jgi:hypothetical protein